MNAELLAQTGLAMILLEEMLSRDSVLAAIRELLQDKEGLLEAKKRAQELTKPSAASELARRLVRLCSERLV
jgi:UDP-N-acetylglucosamine:LPS N-acetylglucosamine transferase